TLSFLVTFNPKRVGTQNATLQFYSNDPFQNPRTLRIEAQAVEPKLELALDTLDFGRSSLYRTLERSVMLKNLGSATVKIDSFALSDTTVFSLVPPIPKSLPQKSEPLPLNIKFTPDGSGCFQSLLKIFWNNPYHQPTELLLMAEADSARLITQPLINFEKQVINTSTIRPINIYNQSHVLIYVDSIRLGGVNADQFILETLNFPLILNPEDSLLSFNVTYRPKMSGYHQAQLDLFSQDIEGHQLTITLQGIALHSSASPLLICSLPSFENFGSVFVNESKSLPFYLANLGNATLTIDSISFSGAQASAFIVTSNLAGKTITPDDTLNNLNISFAPTTAQNYSAELTIYSNDPEHSPFKIQLAGSGKIDSTPAQLSFNSDSLQLTIGQQTTLKVKISDDSTTIQKVTLYLRPGAKGQFQSLGLEQTTSQNWSVVLPESLITERGLEAYFEIEHGGRHTIYPENGDQNPLYLSVSVPQMAFPFATKKEKYQMISLPFFSDLSLKELFTDELGNYDPEKYRIFDWDEDNDEFIEQKDLKRKLVPGYALYLITRDSIVLNASQLKTVPTNKDFQLTVKRGWNMIANPFPFPVSWQEVTNGWPKVPVLYYYNGTGWEIADILQPFKGYAIKIDQGMQVIAFTPKEVSVKVAKAVAIHGWRLQLKAQSGIYHDDFNFVGSLSAYKKLCYNWPEPPTPGKFVSLFFEDKNGQRFTSQFVSDKNSGHQFDFIVNWNTNAPAQIKIVADSLPQGWNWRIVSLDSKLIFNNDSPVSLSQPGTKLRLVVGPADYIRSQTADFLPVPKEFKVGQNFPNPFNLSTTVKFQLPEADRLSVTIFDIQGRKVTTLVNNAPYQAGYYSLHWNGTNANGQIVASGLYILRLKGKKYSAIKKLILQK
ncbi:MAG: choice-of-anchor D domain-containing protein, partial [Caldisericaceae bacterium]|nr:choice-of-anchor D domain-containing protein [Caldisericaceae bacterium]